MKTIKDEIIENFFNILVEAMPAEDPELFKYRKHNVSTPMSETEWSPKRPSRVELEENIPRKKPHDVGMEEKKPWGWSSGESEWSTEVSPGSLSSGESEWDSEEILSGGWPKIVRLPDGKKKIYNSEQEWREDAQTRRPDYAKKRDVEQEPEVDVEGFEAEPEIEVDVEGLENKEQPLDKKYDDDKVIEMIKKDPVNVATNLMLQRKPEYSKFIYPLLKSLVDWASNSGIDLKKGDLLYDEMEYMMNVLEEGADLAEVKKINRNLDKAEEIVDKSTARPISKRI